MARKFGVNGVPFFVLNRKQAISGAQNDRIFEKAIEGALKDMDIDLNQTDVKHCTPQGECK